jgi:hypothetical protein
VTDEPTLGEIGRRVSDVMAELRAIRAELVRRDVYDANRSTDELRVRAIEEDLAQSRQDRGAMRRLVYGALFSAAGSVVVQVIATYAQVAKH